MKNYIVRNEDELFKDFLRDFFHQDTNSNEGIMATDGYEDEKGLYLDIEIPGFKKDEIELNYENGYLYVSAKKSEKEEDKKDKKVSYSMRERNVSVKRGYYVGEINEDAITAKYEDGVLYVELPHKEKKETCRKISIL